MASIYFPLFLPYSHQTWKDKVDEMERTTKIRDKELLWDCIVVLSLVIVMFFVHSVPAIHLNLGWIAVLGGARFLRDTWTAFPFLLYFLLPLFYTFCLSGALSLLLLTGAHDLDDLLQRIEWGTLLFFAALFILMEVGRASNEHHVSPAADHKCGINLTIFRSPAPFLYPHRRSPSLA